MNRTEVFVTAPMPIELEQRARIAAAQQRISRSELVRRAVKAYLKQYAPTEPARRQGATNER